MVENGASIPVFDDTSNLLRALMGNLLHAQSDLRQNKTALK